MIEAASAENSHTMPASKERPKFLALVTVDIMAWFLLRPWLEALQKAGFEVHIACAAGPYSAHLAAAGFVLHPIEIRRSVNPLVQIRPLLELVTLLRTGNFAAINTHSPVASALGRIAGAIARVHPVIYTVHGFYFHDRMPAYLRCPLIALEWLLGKRTDAFMFVSEEDRQTARRIGISGKHALVCTILNGVDLQRFAPKPASERQTQLRREYGIPMSRPVVGIVGRIVREKGHGEFLEMARLLTSAGVEATYLVVGDSLPTDRDQFGPVLRRQVSDLGLANRFVFTGMTERVQDYLALMDVFVLPSYREGFPMSILEAMAAGLPVVATDIRGCRESVVEGITGHLVPPRNAVALRAAVESLLNDPERRKEMGDKAQQIASQKYDVHVVADRFTRFIQESIAVSGP